MMQEGTAENEVKKKVRTAKRASGGKSPRKTKAQDSGKKAERPQQTPSSKEQQRGLFAVIRVRGSVGVTKDITSTLMMLRLDRINHCVIVPKNPNFEGMLQKARYFITWGEISQESLEKIVAKRGRFAGDKRIKDLDYAKELADLILSGKSVKDTGIKPVFRLSPPSKGYESTKILYPKGSLGYRGEKINELLKRMI